MTGGNQPWSTTQEMQNVPGVAFLMFYYSLNAVSCKTVRHVLCFFFVISNYH